MKVRVLGFYGGYPYAGQGTSGYLITADGYQMLLDCGSGVLLELEKVLDPLQLDAVLVSHYHHDHVADLGVLQYYWQLHPDKPKVQRLPIWGHAADPLNFGSLTWPNASVGHAYDPLKVNEIGPFDVTCQLTTHPVPAYALRIKERATGAVLTFTADTAYDPRLAEFAADSDLLMTDTNFTAAKTGQMWHMTTTQSGQVAHDAGVQQLLLTHLPQGVPAEQLQAEAEATAGTDVKVEVAKTGLTIDLAQ